MKPRIILKVITDIAMTVALLFLMTFELIGDKAHEWIGVVMFLLFILHHILNGHWSSHLLKGKYTVLRILQIVLVVLLLFSMIGAMFSGIILSWQVFAFITVREWRSFARNLHMISAYWGFVLMSLHLGLHWNMMMSMAGKIIKKTVRSPHMDTSDYCNIDCGVWHLFLYPSRDWPLYVDAVSFCVLRF